MAIVPKRKTSKQRKRIRRSHHALKTPNLVVVNGEQVPHRLVNFYKKQAQIKPKSKKNQDKKVNN